MNEMLVFVGLLAATGVMRLAELAVSMRRMWARPEAVVAEPALFPLMAALHTLLVFAPIAEVLWFDRPFSGALATISVAVLVAATVLRVWTLSTIGVAWNVRVVAPKGHQIARTGPYAYIRHPNYLAVILEIAALPLFHGAWLSVVGLSVLNGVVLARRIRTEEAVLSAIPEWHDAMHDRARLFPGLF